MLAASGPDAIMVCEDNLSFMRQLSSGAVQLVVTSPPYNIDKSYERQKRSLEQYVAEQNAVIAECVRLLADGGSICWQVGTQVANSEIVPLDLLLYPLFIGHGLKLRNRIVWHFEHGLHCAKRLSGRYEVILWFTKGDDYIFNVDAIRVPSKYPDKRHFKGAKAGQLSGNPLGKNPGDVWIFPNVKSNHIEKTIHPCQFPVELAERLVLALSSPDQVVFDPYMGVGSTVIAALMHGRIGYGCDTVADYVEIARQRIADLRAGRLQTRPMQRPVYDAARPYKPGENPDMRQLTMFREDAP